LGRPSDTARVAEYEAGPYAGFGDEIMQAFSAIVPGDADASLVANAIVKVVDTPFSKTAIPRSYRPNTGWGRGRFRRHRSGPQ
jgi:hypothetical protein